MRRRKIKWTLIAGGLLGLIGIVMVGMCNVQAPSLQSKMKQAQSTHNKQVHLIKVNQNRIDTVTDRSVEDKRMNRDITRLTAAMYNFKNGKEYLANREKAISMIDTSRFSVEKLNKVYPTGLDDSGANMIDNLQEKCAVHGVHIYVNAQEVVEGTRTVDAMVNYEISNASNRRTQNNKMWLRITFNINTHKIEKLEKIGLVLRN